MFSVLKYLKVTKNEEAKGNTTTGALSPKNIDLSEVKTVVTSQQIERTDSKDSANAKIYEHLASYRYTIPDSKKGKSTKRRCWHRWSSKYASSFLP